METNLQIWDDIFKQREWGKYPPIPLVKFIAKNFYSAENRKDIKILELGCGTGANLWYAAREGFTVYGIDFSPTACQIAEKRLRDEGLKDQIGKFLIGDYMEALDLLENNYFDAIIDLESLYCNPYVKTKLLLEKAINKLKPKGKLFSMTFADGTWGIEDIEEYGHHEVKPSEGPLAISDFGRYTTREDINQLYVQSNTKLVNLERSDLLLMNGKLIKEWLIEIQKTEN